MGKMEDHIVIKWEKIYLRGMRQLVLIVQEKVNLKGFSTKKYKLKFEYF